MSCCSRPFRGGRQATHLRSHSGRDVPAGAHFERALRCGRLDYRYLVDRGAGLARPAEGDAPAPFALGAGSVTTVGVVNVLRLNVQPLA